MTIQTDFKSPNALIGEKPRALYAIWRGLAGNRKAPKREEVTLSLVRTLSPWMWTSDVIDRGADFRIRLGGDRIVEFAGQRYAGKLLSDCPATLYFERARCLMAYCVEHRMPVATGPVPSGYSGKEHWEMEVVVLPLSDDGETITQLMGATQFWPRGATTQPDRAAGPRRGAKTRDVF